MWAVFCALIYLCMAFYYLTLNPVRWSPDVRLGVGVVCLLVAVVAAFINDVGLSDLNSEGRGGYTGPVNYEYHPTIKEGEFTAFWEANKGVYRIYHGDVLLGITSSDTGVYASVVDVDLRHIDTGQLIGLHGKVITELFAKPVLKTTI